MPRAATASCHLQDQQEGSPWGCSSKQWALTEKEFLFHSLSVEPHAPSPLKWVRAFEGEWKQNQWHYQGKEIEIIFCSFQHQAQPQEHEIKGRGCQRFCWLEATANRACTFSSCQQSHGMNPPHSKELVGCRRTAELDFTALLNNSRLQSHFRKWEFLQAWFWNSTV